MSPEPAVLCNACGKFIVETEEHRIAVAHLHQLGRERSVVGPERQRPLVQKIGMEAWTYDRCRVDARIERMGFPGCIRHLPSPPSTDASTATFGGKILNCWCDQTAPGGRPSMGPKPPPKAGSTACKVSLQSAVGTGLSGCGCVASTTAGTGSRGQYIETHGLSERLNTEQRATRCACRNATATVSESGGYEGVESMNWSQRTSTCYESPFDEIAA